MKPYPISVEVEKSPNGNRGPTPKARKTPCALFAGGSVAIELTVNTNTNIIKKKSIKKKNKN